MHSILDVRTHLKPTEPFQSTHLDSCNPPGVRKGFIKGEALMLLRITFSKVKFDEHIALFKQSLHHRGYPDNLLNMTLSEVNFSQRMLALQNEQKPRKRICRLLQSTAYQCLISNIFLWTNGISYKTSPYEGKYFKIFPLFHIAKGVLWKMYLPEPNSEVSELEARRAQSCVNFMKSVKSGNLLLPICDGLLVNNESKYNLRRQLQNKVIVNANRYKDFATFRYVHWQF